MKNKLFTVAICIPAYNEQQNIDSILRQILSQEQTGFVIEKIIVASDGSTDDTVKIAREYEHRGVNVIEGKDNRGQNYRQNEVISETASDILVLLNADLILGDKNVISKLIKPIQDGADLTAQWAVPLKHVTFLERILHAGFKMKYYIYTHHKNGNNIYTCVGHMRALSRKFYSNVVFPLVSEGEDQYLYFSCISGGYKYKYIHEKNSFFKLPDTFSDYKKYAKRIFHTQKRYKDSFDPKFVTLERHLPLKILLKGYLKTFIKDPFYLLLYTLLHMFMLRWTHRQPMSLNHVFETSESTKKVKSKNHHNRGVVI